MIHNITTKPGVRAEIREQQKKFGFDGLFVWLFLVSFVEESLNGFISCLHLQCHRCSPEASYFHWKSGGGSGFMVLE